MRYVALSVVTAGLVGASLVILSILLLYPRSPYGPVDVLAEIQRCCPCPPESHE